MGVQHTLNLLMEQVLNSLLLSATPTILPLLLTIVTRRESVGAALGGAPIFYGFKTSPAGRPLLRTSFVDD